MKGNAMLIPVEPDGLRSCPAVLTTAKVIALRQRDPWREASETARQKAGWRETVVLSILKLMDEGRSQNRAIERLAFLLESGTLANHVQDALRNSAVKGRISPAREALHRWVALYREGGINALLPNHKGRVEEAAGWWGPALEYYNAPSKPDMSAVYRRLTEVDGFSVTYERVRDYLNGVPAMLGRCSPARLGKNLYRLREKAYIRRSTQNALPGDVYVADGYRGDVYLAHPVTGGIWRPEFTAAIDLKSRVLVGWRADEHEGTYAVQNMWAECFARWNHVPPFIYVDNGSGYKNRLMDCSETGFYDRAGVQQIIHAIPGNPHGKGWVERFFRIVKDDFLKLWKGGAFYCGDDAAPETLNKLTSDVKAGRVILPSLAEFTEDFNAWVARFCARPHPEDKRISRADVWRRLQPIPPVSSVTELKRQAVTLTVRRASVKHGRREYGHADLHAFNHQKVVLEYDLMDNSVGIIRTETGRWICDAHLISAIDVIDKTRLEEKREDRVEHAIRRLEKKMEEQKARAGHVFDADASADALEIPTNPAPLLEGEAECLPPGEDEIKLFDL